MKSWRHTVLSFSALPEAAALLLAPDPAWIWSRDGSHILWANPAGGARIGAANLDQVLRRRWPEGHALRRHLVSLSRTMPEQGTMARLRIVDDHRSLPFAVRVRRVRTGDDRGLLVVAATEGATGRTPLARLASFFSGEDMGAVVLDETGEVLAESAPGLAAMVVPGRRGVEITEAGRKVRLFLLDRAAAVPDMASSTPPPAAGRETESFAEAGMQSEVAAIPMSAQPAAPVAEEQPKGEAQEQRGASGGEGQSPRREAEAISRPPPERIRLLSETESRAAELAWISPMSTGLAAENAARQPIAAPAKPVSIGRTGRRDPRTPASTPSERTESVESVARSVSAGRVPRELSRKPVRFLWQTDAADRFLFVSPGLAQVVGRNAEIVGERWQDAAARLRLDPTLRIARALAQRDTWSGLTAWWPIEGSNVRVPAELTALPVFGSDQSFQGYRGFGVLRSAEALMPPAFEARFGTAEQPVPRPATQLPSYEEAITTIPANVVPIRATLERLVDQTRLTPQERNAFEEIAAALSQRVIEPPLGEEERDEEPAHAALIHEPSPVPSANEAEVEPDDTGFRTAAGSTERRAETPTIPEGEPDTPGVAAAAEPPAAPAAEPPAAESVTALQAEPAGPPNPLSAAATDEAAAAPISEAARQARAHRKFRAGEAERRLREMYAVLDTATDGVLILDANGMIESANASAEALFGLDWHEMQSMPLGELLTPESRQSALDYLEGLKENGVASVLNEGREVEGGLGDRSIPLFMTMGRISGEDGGRFCVVLRDITHWKRTEAELLAAKRAAEAASHQKSEFLARVSHEIRTPLNAIIGFAEVMIEERFGPIENERYREYLRDIRTSGEHVVSLVNDLLDISKIEAGKVDLSFVAVPLNDLVRECIALMQPEANRAHVVLRSSLSREVPAIVADQRTMRQIVLNLLSNSVKFTGPGGQVIASTSLAESGEAMLRIRDTGEGMSEEELARALEPFRQIATATLSDRSGTGLGLPLTKALVQANRASLSIRSARGEGTVVTVTFPPTRVLSE
ncbi:MAG TPA: ATP-binding protein [Propylenella sp.]|nr:ATP-binding protein [Propylenella sp.]